MNTLLITDNEVIKQKLQDKLALLRETDKLLSVNYSGASDALYDVRPEIVILHEDKNREKTLELIKSIKEKKIFVNTRIILFANDYDKSFILSAYDFGIDDYITQKSDTSEILIRVINCIKKFQLENKLNLYANHLRSYSILEQKNDFYSAKYEKDIFGVRLHMDNYKGGCYIIIAPDDKSKSKLASDAIVSAVRKSVRTDDMVAGLSAAKYSILIKSGLDAALKVISKIKEELSDAYSIKAGIAIIDTENFEDVKKKATCALNNALLQNVDYMVYSEDSGSQAEWLEESQGSDKAYKFFKKAIAKKIDNVIAPVFYRNQKAYEEKVGDAKIEQFTDEQQSVFRIISGKNESRLTMRYPGYAKLIVYISHSGLDSPEDREISLPINKITETQIDEILESFINEFIGIYRHIYHS